MRTIPALLLLCAPAAASAAGALREASVSTGSARPMSVADIYRGEKYRDPFVPVQGSGPAAPSVPAGPSPAGAASEEEAPEFSIHALNLKGVLKDASGAFAVLSDALGTSYVLKDGRLFDQKNKRVEGVTGVIQMKQKTVILMTPDKDVQTLKLGVQEEPEQKER